MRSNTNGDHCGPRVCISKGEKIKRTALGSTRDQVYTGLEAGTRFKIADTTQYWGYCNTETTTGNTVLSWSHVRDRNNIIAQYDNTFYRHIDHRLN